MVAIIYAKHRQTNLPGGVILISLYTCKNTHCVHYFFTLIFLALETTTPLPFLAVTVIV